jgi:hypothetical protein
MDAVDRREYRCSGSLIRVNRFRSTLHFYHSVEELQGMLERAVKTRLVEL